MSIKIVVAEDSPVDSLVLRNVLKRAGYTPLLASNGVEALELLESDSEVRLLMADVQMPGMGGIDLVRKVRDTESLADLPVVFVSGVADAETVRHAVELQSMGYILKPIREPSRILELVKEALGLVELTG